MREDSFIKCHHMKQKLVSVILIASFCQIISGQSANYEVNRAFFSSEKYDEFSPVYYKNEIVFCSNRNQGLANHTTSLNKGLFKIYSVDTTSKGNWRSAGLFSKNLTTIFNDGPVTFNRTKDTIYFSRNQEVKGKLSTVSNTRNKLGIYYAVLINGQWGKVTDLRINSDYYNVTTPCLSPDGRKIFFTSDKPDGFGGSDLYFSEWKDDRWDDPVNLGPEINTTGNESYPFVNSSGELFFSSDGHKGQGGKDIFYSKEVGSSWLSPVPLDPPINSQYDDFAFTEDSLMREGYFSSDREGSIDIYQYKTLIHQLFNCGTQRTNEYCFRFTDDSKIPIDEDYLQYVWSFGDGTSSKGLNVDHCFPGPGKFKVSLDVVEKNSGKSFFSKLSYNLELKNIEQAIINVVPSAVAGESVEFDGISSYFPGSHILTYTWYFGDGDKTTGAKVNHKFNLKGEYEVKLGLILSNDKTGVIFQSCSSRRIMIAASKQEKSSYDAAQKEPSEKNNIFNYDHAFINDLYSAEKEYNQDVVFQVEILSSKNRMSLDDKAFVKLPKKYSLSEVRDRTDNSYRYIADEEMNLMDTYPAYHELVALGFRFVRIRTFEVEDPAAKELLALKRVFGVSADVLFKPNDFSLSSPGTQLLDLIMGFMSKYPAIKLEISTYTDNAGTSYSNGVLSQKRADTMVNYLVTNGVNGSRLVPRGYGDSRPINRNSNEAERKLNRRVDFMIIK